MDTFKINSAEEAKKFEELTNSFMRLFSEQSIIANFDLERVFKDCSLNEKNGGRIFTAVFDLFTTFYFCQQDIYSASNYWNKFFSKESQLAKKEESIFENPNAFAGRISIQRFLNTFIIRYRSLWDKIFGLYVLIYNPEDYQNFLRAKSRKKYFKSNYLDKDFIPQKVKDYFQHLSLFDEKYRTAEVHGSGTTRKTIYKKVEDILPKDEPFRDIFENHWGVFINMLGLVLEMLNDIKKD